MHGIQLLTKEIERAVARIFDDPSTAAILLGEDGVFPDSWREDPPDVALPLERRLNLFRRWLEEYIVFKGEELEDLGENEAQRINAETVSLLVMLRELARHLPEAFRERGSDG